MFKMMVKKNSTYKKYYWGGSPAPLLGPRPRNIGKTGLGGVRGSSGSPWRPTVNGVGL